jgi:CRP-like cAMP-binding protein
MLLNCPVVSAGPGDRLIEDGQRIDILHLIIGGVVERIAGGSAKGGGFTAGSLIGEVPALAGLDSIYDYRCRTHAKTLAIPLDLFREFLLRSDMVDQLLERADSRSFLRNTRLCAEALSETDLSKLAQVMRRQRFKAGEIIEPRDALGVMASGTVSLSRRTVTMEMLQIGEVFNEARAMFGRSGGYRVRAEENCEICFLPAAAIRQVPLLRWTLLELVARRSFADILPFQRNKKAQTGARRPSTASPGRAAAAGT